MDGIISIANGASSSLYGCIGCAIKDMIISKFPKDYFKYTSVSSELATRNMRRTFGGNNNNVEIKKRIKPYLVIQPTYSVMDQDGPLQSIPLTKNFDDLQYRTDKRYLFDVIKDTKNNFNLKFKLNRDRIEFDVTVTTSTLHQQLDIYRMILNQFIWDRSYAFRMALESIIPKKLIWIMSKYCNMDLERSDAYIPILLRRLNACSGYPITYKLRNATSTDEWFMYYTHNVLVTFTDLSIESGNKKNMVDEAYNITFKVTADFNMPGVYMLDGVLDESKNLDSVSYSSIADDGSNYIPIFAISNLQSRFPAEMNGMQLYGTTMFRTTAQKNQTEDRVDISCVLDSDHIRVIRAHKAWNMDPSTLLNFYIVKDDNIMVEGRDYKIDWNRLELIILDIDNASTYRLIMYFNYATVNEILSNTAYHNNYDVDKLSTNNFPDNGLVDGEIITHGKNDQFETADTYGLEEDPTYCDGEHGNIDPDTILYPNRVFVHEYNERIKKPSDMIFLPEYVDENAKDPIILEDDPTYCDDEEHGNVDPDTIIHNNSVFVKGYNDRITEVSDSILLPSQVNDDVNEESVVILEDDPTYCDDGGIDISQFSIAGINDDDSNADIHNSIISTKSKKYSSSI